MTDLSIVIPVYNEEKTLERVVNTVLKQDWRGNIEVIIVDDGSKDRSREIAKSLAKKSTSVRTLENKKNMGKSQTVKRGILASTGKFVTIQDADLEYDVSELCAMFKVISEDEFDVVYGNRFGKKNKVIYIQNYIGNHFVSLFSNFFTYPRIKVYIPDMEVCYKLAKGDIFREVAEKIVSKSNFGFEPEVTARFARYKKDGKHLKFSIYPISYTARTIQEGKKMKAFQDGFKAAVEIVKFNIW
ncbi:MAG: glycosyltransferase family 2 protein [Candidatus Dojkabacteria bacterium]|nr:MAG: glycosyltransferase family 2 protein [Candidatus Dojkabacteria bacterium]